MAAYTSLGKRSVSSLQVLTEGAPVDGDGVSLIDVLSIIPIIRAPLGQTLLGTGTLLGYVFANGSWVRLPQADLDLTAAAGLAAAALPTLPVGSPRDRFTLVAAGVGVSAGANVTVDMLCVSRSGLEAL